MSQPIDDGGPAFPFYLGINHRESEYVKGMTMLDYFAAKALQGMLAADESYREYSAEEGACIADQAYAIASAMLKSRKA